MSDRAPHPGQTGAIVGRSRETALLNTHLGRALAGQRSLVLIGGEAGIGKTHIVNGLRKRATDRGALVLIGHCYDTGAVTPYEPWIEILSTPDLAATNPAAHALFEEILAARSVHNQRALFHEVVRLLESVAASTTVVLVLEDLHWADTASLELLRTLSRQAERLPALIVATYRNDELTRANPLYRFLPLLVREADAERIELHGLGVDAISQLVGQRYGLPGGSHRQLVHYLDVRGQGNPFFINELLFALQEQHTLHQTTQGWQLEPVSTGGALDPVPLLVRQVIDDRLERLGPKAQRDLRIAAVIGQEVPVDLWRELSDSDEHGFLESTRRAIDAHLLDESPDGRRLRFRHALVRDALYAGVVLPERRLIHQRVAEILERRSAPPDAVAHHFALAGDPRAIKWLTLAGERALDVYAPDSAITHLTRALELAQETADVPPAGARRLRGLAYATIGEFNKARSDLSAELEAARRSDDRHSEWLALVDLGSLWSERDYSRTRQYYDDALALARTMGDDATVAHSLNRMSNWFLNNNQPVEAIAHAEESLAIFRRIGDARGVATTTRMLGLDNLVRGDLVACNRWFRDAIDQFEILDDRYGLCAALTGLIYTAGTYTFHTEIPGPIGPDELHAVSSKAKALATETRWRAGEAYVYLAMGSYYGIRGAYDQAISSTHQGLEIATEIDHQEWMALGHQILGRLHLDLLGFDEAERQLHESLALAERVGAPLHRRLAASYLAHIHIERGETQAALEMLGPPVVIEKPPQTVIGRKAWSTRATIALGSGDAELALAITDVLLRTSLNGSAKRVPPLYARLRGEALARLGRYDEAEQQLLIAANAALDAGYRPVLWRLCTAIGKLYQDAGRVNEANEWFERARTTVAEIADLIPDDTLRTNFLRATANRIPEPRSLTQLQAAKLVYGGLTARQRDVARLVALGYSNSEIATTLHISNRTAEGHVTAILTRLDFGSRAQIAAWAVDRGLVELQD